MDDLTQFPHKMSPIDERLSFEFGAMGIPKEHIDFMLSLDSEVKLNIWKQIQLALYLNQYEESPIGSERLIKIELQKLFKILFWLHHQGIVITWEILSQYLDEEFVQKIWLTSHSKN